MRIRAGELESSLQRSIAQAYALLLDKYVRVTLNGDEVRPLPVPIGQSGELHAAKSKRIRDDVRIQFFASLIAPKKEWKAERAGWYVVCNGRMVLAADKSPLTGWGTLKLPSFHSKYTGFIGVALLDSKDALALPWTTTKESLNRESAVYQELLREIVALSRPILNFLNKMYPSDLEENPIERDAAEQVQPSSLPSLVGQKERVFEATLKPRKRSTVRVQYNAEKKHLNRVRQHLGKPSMGANKIGELTLNYYLDVECPE